MPTSPHFTFNFYPFVGTNGSRTTELVRDRVTADEMRALFDRNTKLIEIAT